ncbi:1-acyl-sn-glycerol-3-phosphate acyltransferase [Suicoccus acidiformans]|uniref:1-acyl-sn-glycerol-3-phosphate acyltransferase n=1 Tax=Suicoccus acidiformans TaxID=2036206 RepID=A0A347WLE9_9LACT|nr:lysophospholipid acyltransferase family protein [Suicoccus acidiformans]AXY25906.1 1-acyl-sn-glycerol-3-phosphate acyltransferase [Suicoccus acidiformans]
MTAYDYLVRIIRFFMYLLNGKPKVYGTENLPQDNTGILAMTHLSNTDPFLIAITIYPLKVAFMAKQELFTWKPLAYILGKGNVFPVNREKPSTQTIRHAATVARTGEAFLGIFPTGTRHSTEIKPGTGFIQGMSKTNIIPVAIDPPIGFFQFITRKKAKIIFGEPITYEPDVKYDKKKLAEIDGAIESAFTKLRAELDRL